MAPRSRILWFGSAAALVVAGALCAVFVRGTTGHVLTIALLLGGLGGALLLVFLEVGLGEERARAMEEERRRQRAAHESDAQRRMRPRYWPRRPG